MSEVLPEGWCNLSLNEVVNHFQNGYAFSAKNYTSAGIPIVSMVHIGLNGIFNSNNKKQKFWDISKKEELSRYIVKSGDIIIAMTDVTPTMELIGRGCLVKSTFDYLLNQRVGLLKTKNDLVYKAYLAYYFNYDYWRLYCIGSSGLGAQANLGTTEILNGNLLLPPLPEQKKIAKILTSVDEVIDTTENQINKLKDLKKGMMNELLTKGIGHTKFKDSAVGRIPVAWECELLDNISLPYTFKNRRSPVSKGDNVGRLH